MKIGLGYSFELLVFNKVYVSLIRLGTMKYIAQVLACQREMRRRFLVLLDARRCGNTDGIYTDFCICNSISRMVKGLSLADRVSQIQAPYREIPNKKFFSSIDYF